MAKLQFSLDGNALGEYELNKERTTIGRRPVNDIHIDNLAVSGEHATITTIGDDSFLEDLNSTNGTLVNNKLIKKHVLHHNDVIEFGKYQLLYVNPAQANTPANHGGFENTVVMRPAKLKLVAAEVNASEATEIAEETLSLPTTLAVEKASAEPELSSSVGAGSADNSTKMGRLQMLNGANVGRELVLNKALNTLGKLGTQVAVITKRSQTYFITHVEGDNLPLVNSQKIGLQAHALNDQDVIEMAGLKMKFLQA